MSILIRRSITIWTVARSVKICSEGLRTIGYEENKIPASIEMAINSISRGRFRYGEQKSARERTKKPNNEWMILLLRYQNHSLMSVTAFSYWTLLSNFIYILTFFLSLQNPIYLQSTCLYFFVVTHAHNLNYCIYFLNSNMINWALSLSFV